MFYHVFILLLFFPTLTNTQQQNQPQTQKMILQRKPRDKYFPYNKNKNAHQTQYWKKQYAETVQKPEESTKFSDVRRGVPTNEKKQQYTQRVWKPEESKPFNEGGWSKNRNKNPISLKKKNNEWTKHQNEHSFQKRIEPQTNATLTLEPKIAVKIQLSQARTIARREARPA